MTQGMLLGAGLTPRREIGSHLSSPWLSPGLTSAGRSRCPWCGVRQRGGSQSALLALSYLEIFELLT